MDELKEFQIRVYGKQELAMLYLPHHTPMAAKNALMRWINGDQELLQKLKTAGYQPLQKTFNPKQVHLILEYFDRALKKTAKSHIFRHRPPIAHLSDSTLGGM